MRCYTDVYLMRNDEMRSGDGLNFCGLSLTFFMSPEVSGVLIARRSIVLVTAEIKSRLILHPPLTLNMLLSAPLIWKDNLEGLKIFMGLQFDEFPAC